MTSASLLNLEGRVVLLTGATDGIGKAAARVFALLGATLILVGRNASKAAAVASDLQHLSGRNRVSALVADLSRRADVRTLAATFRSRHDRLDVLACNVGARFATRQHTSDGLEQTFALNHLGGFLLTHELMPLLKGTPGARVVVTSSRSHRGGVLSDVEEVARREREYVAQQAYADSKLANILFTRELARRVAGAGVVANCFDPGFVRTAFGSDDPFRRLVSGFARAPEKGAETLVWLAASEAASRISGRYFRDQREAPVTQTIPTPAQCGMAMVALLSGNVAARLHHPALSVELPLALLATALIRRGLLRGDHDLDAAAARLWAFSDRVCRSA